MKKNFKLIAWIGAFIAAALVIMFSIKARMEAKYLALGVSEVNVYFITALILLTIYFIFFGSLGAQIWEKSDVAEQKNNKALFIIIFLSLTIRAVLNWIVQDSSLLLGVSLALDITLILTQIILWKQLNGITNLRWVLLVDGVSRLAELIWPLLHKIG